MTMRESLNHLRGMNFFFNSKDIEIFFAQQPEQRHEMDFVYFARYGKSFDGHKFALQIVRSKNFIVGEKSRILNFFQNSNEQQEILESKYFLLTECVEKSLEIEMKNLVHIHDLNFKSIGVTGTSGKTSVVQLIGQILSFLQRKTLKIGTLGIEIDDVKSPNSHLTTPDYPAFVTALMDAKKSNVDTLVMEVSSHGLSQSRLNDYQFDITAFTNFSQDHLDFHKSMDEYFEAKTLLFSKHFKANGHCVISTQSSRWIDIVKHCVGTERTLYLLVDSNLDSILAQIKCFKDAFKHIFCLNVENKKTSLDGLSGEFHLVNDDGKTVSKNSFSTKLIGSINFENLMCAFCACLILGHPVAEFISLFEKLTGVPGRMEKVGDNVFVDYSHKPGALESVLKTIRNLLSANQKLITVFGCGGDRDTTKRPLMGQIAAQFSDKVIITSDNPRSEDPNKIIEQIVAGISETHHCFIESDRRRAIQVAFEIAQKSDIILIAGKGHETYQIVGNQKFDFSDVKIAEEFSELRNV